MQKQKYNKKVIIKNNEEGITLLALVVTIIILLILSGITISSLSGDNGLINSVIKAKEQSEIKGETEIVEMSSTQAMGKDKYGDLRYNAFKKQLDTNSNNGTELEEDDGDFFVTFISSQRIYEVDRDGNVIYSGTYTELQNKATILASPESNPTPQYVQTVDLTLKTGIAVSEEDVTLKYCWSLDNGTEPTEEYTVASISSSGGRKWIAPQIVSTFTDENNYYLWAKAVVNGNEFIKCFGPYAIKEHTTLMYVGGTGSSYTGSEAAFLGNTYGVTRGKIESITITNSFTDSYGITHSLADDNCWDVSANSEGNKNGNVLAWYTQNGDYYDVTIAQEGGVIANANSSYLFSYIGYSVDNTVTINGLQYLDTSETTNMSNMFSNCSKVTSLDVSGFNTTNVTNMKGIFANCVKLANLDVSGFDTSNVTEMTYMFLGCSSLTSLDLSNFNTNNVTDMVHMFYGCKGLTSLDLSKFNTSNVTDMGGMFYFCTGLINLNVSDFNTSNVKGMGSMFAGCSSLTSLDVSGFDTSNVTNMNLMFYNCRKLSSLDVSNFDTGNVTNMSSMFQSCSGLISLDVSRFNTSKVTNMSGMFLNCSQVENLDVSKFDTSKVTNISGMFQSCRVLTSLNVSEFNTSNVTNMEDMFNGCSGLTSLDVSKFDTSKVTNMSSMFKECRGLTDLDVIGFDTRNVTNMAGMFGNCSELTSINVNEFDISNVKYIGINSTDTGWYSDSFGTFYGCSKLTELDLSTWDTSNVISMRGLFNGCTNLNILKLNKFTTSQITDSLYYQSMFTNVPTTVEITTNTAMKTWLNTNFASYTNIVTID